MNTMSDETPYNSRLDPNMARFSIVIGLIWIALIVIVTVLFWTLTNRPRIPLLETAAVAMAMAVVFILFGLRVLSFDGMGKAILVLAVILFFMAAQSARAPNAWIASPDVIATIGGGMVLFGCWLLAGDQRRTPIGLALIGLAVLLLATATIARSTWPLQPKHFVTGGIATILAGLGILVKDMSGENRRPLIEDVAGVTALTGLVGFSAAIVISARIEFFANPFALGIPVLLFGLTGIAGKRWRTKLSITSLAPLLMLICVSIRPQWLLAFRDAVAIKTKSLFVWPNYPVPLSGLLFAAYCLLRRPRPPWRGILMGTVLVICVTYIIRTIFLMLDAVAGK
jgi:hypothetical protein